MDVRIYQERIAENEKAIVSIFNPTSQEFSINYKDQSYTVLPSSELKLPYYAGEMFVRKIVDYMINRRTGSNSIISPLQKEELEKRVRLYEQNTVD